MSRCESKKGDVFSFVKWSDGVTFNEAVRIVADESGMPEEQAQPLGLQEPTTEQSQQVREYLERHGVPIEFLKKYSRPEVVVHPERGLAIGFKYDSDEKVIKYRAIDPKAKDQKFWHAAGHPWFINSNPGWRRATN